MSPDKLGVDSLVAIELRSWFLKEIGVDMPVLKIFNAASIKELLKFAVTLIPAGLIPDVKSADGESSSEAVPIIAQHPAQGFASASDTVQTPDTESDEDTKAFNLEYLPSNESGSGSSAASTKGDSSSEQNDETSSSASSVDDSIEVSVVSKKEVDRELPMSYSQSRFFFLKSFVEDKTAFNVTPVFELHGRLRVEDFTRAVETVMQRHQALRTFFFTNADKKGMQGIWKKSSIRLERHLVSDETEIEAAKEQMRSHIFNIAEGEIIRVQLLSLRSDKHWLIFGFDHINMDGMSFEILWSELEQVYNGSTLPPGTMQYPDYALRQHHEYEGGSWVESLAYWRREFQNAPVVVPLLPFSRSPVRPQTTVFGSHQAHMQLDRKLLDDIKKCATTFKVTLNQFFLAVWQIFLLRLFDIDDICIGLGDANRTDPDVKQSVGLFLNLVPIRFHRNTSQSFGEALKNTKLVSQSAFSYAHVPLSIILSELNVPRSTSHSPLFQVSFNYRPGVAHSRKFCGCTATGSLFTTGGISYDLHLDVVDVGDEDTSIYLLVQKDLYEQEYANILLRGFHSLLQAFLQNPATKVPWPSLFSHDDIERGLDAGRGEYSFLR